MERANASATTAPKSEQGQPRTLITLSVLLPAYTLWLLAPGSRTFFPFVITGYCLALLVYRRRGEKADDLFARRIWLHETSRNEALLLLVVYAFGWLGMDRLARCSPVSMRELALQGLAALRLPVITRDPTLLAGVLYVLASLAAFELAYYWAHRLLHANRRLWEFHKVHHSAQVMTPFTSLRQHPVEVVVNRAFQVVAGGLVAACFLYFYPAVPTLTMIAGNHLLLWFLMLFGNSLGHSHAWISYGKLENVIISPAMHQIHHSADPGHFGRNFGFMLSFWDRLFGTLYIPTKRESLTFGLGEAENRKFLTLKDLVLSPFARAVAPDATDGGSPS